MFRWQLIPVHSGEGGGLLVLHRRNHAFIARMEPCLQHGPYDHFCRYTDTWYLATNQVSAICSYGRSGDLAPDPATTFSALPKPER
jgi:hypothetical protein